MDLPTPDPEFVMVTPHIPLTPNDVKRLAGMARGFFRDHPRRKWTMREYKQAARLAVHQLVLRELGVSGLSYYQK